MKNTKVILISIFLLLSLQVKSQTTDLNKKTQFIEVLEPKTGRIDRIAAPSGDYTRLEVFASFNGGPEVFQRYLLNHITYPREARKGKVKGTVKISFIVDTDGTVKEVKILEGIGAGCDEECIRVVQLSSKKWTAGIVNDRYVPTEQQLLISFEGSSIKMALLKSTLL